MVHVAHAAHVRRLARDAEPTRSAPRLLVRLGFVSRGAIYALVGALAVALASGAGGSAAPDQQGALHLIDRAPLGALGLAILAAGLLAYAVWKIWQGVRGYGPEGGGGASLPDRAVNLAGGAAYLGFFALAIGVLAGAGAASGQSGGPQHAAAGVLGWPGGPVLVTVAGVVFLVVCLVQAYWGASGRFMQQDKTHQMSERQRRAVGVFGRVGWVARALVFGLIGYFLIRAAVDYDPNKAVGLDGALRAVYRLPLGSLLLALVAAGLLAFAAFSLAEARFRRL